jgi:hypothetical protein
MVGLDAAKRKDTAQLVPHAIVAALLVGESPAYLLRVPAVVVQELGLALEHHSRVGRHLSPAAAEPVPVRLCIHRIGLVVTLVVPLNVETVVEIAASALLLDR